MQLSHKRDIAVLVWIPGTEIGYICRNRTIFEQVAKAAETIGVPIAAITAPSQITSTFKEEEK